MSRGGNGKQPSIVGIPNTLNGLPIYYAGGGGGIFGQNGLGGGGAPNTGGGGGSDRTGSNGGSGIVIIAISKSYIN
jgi:hypothetical protein